MDFIINAIYTLSLTALFSLIAVLALYLTDATEEAGIFGAVAEAALEPILHLHAEKEHDAHIRENGMRSTPTLSTSRPQRMEAQAFQRAYQRAIELEHRQQEASRAAGYPNIVWIGSENQRTQSKHAS